MPLKRSYRKSSRRPARKRVYRKSKVSLKVKRYVKREIHRLAEDKHISVNNQVAFGNVTESPDLNIYPMMPYPGFISIPQSVLVSGRVGNTIRIKKVMLNYTLVPLPYDAVTNANPQPIICQFFLGNVKNSRGVIPSVVAGDFNQIVDIGSTSSALAGNLQDLCCEFNRDYWDMKKVWTHKLGFANYEGTGAEVDAQYRSNNDYRLNYVKKLNITKYCPKTVKFNDGTNQQQGPNLFFMFQCVGSGGGILGATTLQARINYWVHIHYEDQ